MRQYNNFIALMDNYKTFNTNVDIAKNSSGTLKEQSDIYAESWEAARDRVRAAAEGIYQDLLDDEAFIKILNTVEKLISGIDKFIESLGGLKTLLPVLTTLLLRLFDK
jgi:hypothetical protein